MYKSILAANLVNMKNFDVPEWDGLAPYLAFVFAAIARVLVIHSTSEGTEDTNENEDEEEGEDLCHCQFSLAYSAKILLNTARSEDPLPFLSSSSMTSVFKHPRRKLLRLLPL